MIKSSPGRPNVYSRIVEIFMNMEYLTKREDKCLSMVDNARRIRE